MINLLAIYQASWKTQ